MPSSDEKVVRKLSYADVEFLCTQIGSKLSSANYCPDLIVGVARGGSIPAAMLAYELKKWFHLPAWQVVQIFASSYEGQDKGRRLVIDVPSSIRALMHQATKVLIVDDIYDSGDTLSGIDYQLRDTRRRVDIRTATLLTKDHAGPDFYGRLIEPDQKDEWVHFPWEA